MSRRIEILTLGDELLSGLVVNGNAACLAERLVAAGHRVVRMTTVGDDEAAIVAAFREAVGRVEALVATGGLGPTPDDRTRFAVARLLACPLVHSPEIEGFIRRRFADRGLPFPEVNRIQADIPEKAEAIPNPVGTAPGLFFHLAGVPCFVLPGVPLEAEAMLTGWVIPRLGPVKERPMSRLLQTFGLPESAIAERLKDFSDQFPQFVLTYLPRSEGVFLRLCGIGEAVQPDLDAADAYIRERLGVSIYATEGESIEAVVGRLLLDRRWTIATAESCTGGLLAHRMIRIPGSSAYFERGVVAYRNAAKKDLLGVHEELLRRHGAVSAEVAQAMADGIRTLAGTHVGVSITGIAGPGGGTPEKPVGLVYIGYADPEKRVVEAHRLTMDRIRNQERATMAALDLIRRMLDSRSSLIKS